MNIDIDIAIGVFLRELVFLSRTASRRCKYRERRYTDCERGKRERYRLALQVKLRVIIDMVVPSTDLGIEDSIPKQILAFNLVGL